MKNLKSLLVLAYLMFLASSCTQDSEDLDQLQLEDATAIDLAQTSGQLVSGTSFTINGNSTQAGTFNSRVTEVEHNGIPAGPGFGKGFGKGGHKGIMDGLNLLAPNDEILAIIDAESSGEIRGFRVAKLGGATITHLDKDGNKVNLPLPSSIDGPHQGPSGNQFPELDSLLALIVKTEIDFGAGVTITRRDEDITRKGKIIVERSKSDHKLTEVVTFENYSVNGIRILGIKTTVSTLNRSTGKGTQISNVENGKFIFADGTEAVWTSDKKRISEVTFSNDKRRPKEGTIVHEVKTKIVAAGGGVIYSHMTKSPLVIDLACEGRRRGPIDGILETRYRENSILVDYGNGTCTNQTITIKINGLTITKTIGG
jgi:hypothetical protein